MVGALEALQAEQTLGAFGRPAENELVCDRPQVAQARKVARGCPRPGDGDAVLVLRGRVGQDADAAGGEQPGQLGVVPLRVGGGGEPPAGQEVHGGAEVFGHEVDRPRLQRGLHDLPGPELHDPLDRQAACRQHLGVQLDEELALREVQRRERDRRAARVLWGRLGRPPAAGGQQDGQQDGQRPGRRPAPDRRPGGHRSHRSWPHGDNSVPSGPALLQSCRRAARTGPRGSAQAADGYTRALDTSLAAAVQGPGPSARDPPVTSVPATSPQEPRVEPSARQPALDPDVRHRARIARRARRRRPSGEAPPLPRKLSRSGAYWLILVAVIVVLWTVIALEPAAGPVGPGEIPRGTGFRLGVTISRADQAVVEWLAGLRSGALTHLARAVHAFGSRWVVRVLYWAVVLALVVFRRFRHLFVFLGATLAVIVLAAGAAALLERPRPFGVQILGSWEGFSQPSRPVAVLTAVLVGMLYTLVPQGRWRELGKWLVVVPVTALGLARVYLAVDAPTDVLVAAAFGVALPLAAFRLLVPGEVFPVTYGRGRAAHLDVGGARGAAICRALEGQLGLVVADVQPFGLAGSAGSTPLKVTVKGDPETYLFAKLLAANHLRSDRWYKLGRSLLYGRLEDEKAFNTVRRLVQQEDYALRLLANAGVRSPEPWGVVEITPEREYLIVFEFFDGAREIGDPDVEADEGVIDDGLRTIRCLWDAGLAHRDVKPANLLVRDGQVYLIDVFFTEVRPSPWRQAVDLANMMLCLALRSSPEQVYERARRVFSDEEISEAFAATRGLAMPSQLRRMIRAQGRDLHAEFLKLLPTRPVPISIQRWTSRRIGLLVTALLCALLVVPMAISILVSAGLL